MFEYIERLLNIESILEKKSVFLLGARQTGKSSIIREKLGDYKAYRLLEQDTFLALQKNPERIRQALTGNEKIIIIDEIQKIPQLLDEVHLMIEEYGIKFLLTGSSVRKLKRKGVHLLGGRARSKMLHPFSARELGEQFELDRALAVGLIPSIYLSDEPYEDLLIYVGEYLQTEIANEALTRNLGAFSRFLEVAAQCHAQIINFAEISSDAQVPASTVREYFQILVDTLIAYELPAFKKTIKRKPLSTSKLYFFDIGVVHALQKRKNLESKTHEWGLAFESYIFHELKSYCDYNSQMDLHYWRSKSQFEVDFILDERVAIEVKSKSRVVGRDLKGLRALREEDICKRFIVVCDAPEAFMLDGIEIMPWRQFVAELWKNQL